MKHIIGPTWTSLAVVVALITVTWTVSSVGYFDLTEAFGWSRGYNDAPVALAIYYGAWALVVNLVFRPDFSAWTRRRSPGEDLYVLPLMLVVFAVFALKVLPRLPEITPPEGKNVADIAFAEPWYFLPKTVEILFQQILLTALVFEMQALKVGLWRMAGLIAVLFGGFHLSLALTDATDFYVARYTVAATLYGAIFPYMILRMRNGFFAALGIHWAFYAFDTVMLHLVFGGQG